jgi:hypothetical protein
VSKVIGELRMGKPSEQIEVKLYLSVDSMAFKEFDAAFETLKAKRFEQ